MKAALILAGGGGHRLWPLSVEDKPKQLLTLFSNESLLAETVRRIEPLVGKKNIYLVTGEDQKLLVQDHVGLPEEQIICEPCQRNTAPAISLGAFHLLDIIGEDAIVITLPSDHYIEGIGAFHSCLEKACEVAEDGWLVTLGVPPHRPETGYGYIETGEVISPRCFRVSRFIEKPSAQKVREFLEKGNFYWNCGIFVWKLKTLWDVLMKFVSEVVLPLEDLRRALKTVWHERIREIYPKFPSISIDYAVMEKADNVAMVPATFKWQDIGSWASLWEILDKDVQGNVIRGNVGVLDVKNSILWSDPLPLRVIGLTDVVVVATPKGILICSKGRSQEVRKLISR